MGGSRKPDWPAWWGWEIELSSHVLKRMVDRRFSEIDIRRMLADATNLREDREPGRWIVEASLANRRWQVIVEPDSTDRLIVVITAFAVEKP